MAAPTCPAPLHHRAPASTPTCTVDEPCSPAASTASAAVRWVREKGEASTSTRAGGWGRADRAACNWRLGRGGRKCSWAI